MVIYIKAIEKINSVEYSVSYSETNLSIDDFLAGSSLMLKKSPDLIFTPRGDIFFDEKRIIKKNPISRKSKTIGIMEKAKENQLLTIKGSNTGIIKTSIKLDKYVLHNKTVYEKTIKSNDGKITQHKSWVI